MKGMRRVIEIKQIVIPVTDFHGEINDTEKVIVKWVCPTCGEKLGQPEFVEVDVNGKLLTLHLFVNVCNHRTKYEELIQLKRII